jgi:sugar lactone lactonase YvrE
MGRAPISPSGVYRWHNGTVQLVAKNVQGGRVNGIALSLDDRFLYAVAVPEGVPRRIARYTVRPDGTLTDERLFFALPVEKILATRESGRPDGVKVDVKGNVYFGGPGGLWIVSPDGKHLGIKTNPPSSHDRLQPRSSGCGDDQSTRRTGQQMVRRKPLGPTRNGRTSMQM